MSTSRFVATATLAAFLSTAATPALAQTTPASSPLRSSIDRAAKSAQVAKLPARKDAPVRKAAMQGGGGGGMMVMTLIGTLAGVATTYFVIKEMRKQQDEVNQPQ
jgi:hypothetical protein